MNSPRLICSPVGFRVEGWGSEGIFRHFEVVEDEARVSVELALGGGDAVARVGVDDADGEAA